VVSATDPHGSNVGFLDPEPLLFHSSISSVILTRLSGPRSRPVPDVMSDTYNSINYFVGTIVTYQTRSDLLYEGENSVQEEIIHTFSKHVACFLCLQGMNKKR
jgi:hypothetical protein